MFDPRTQFFIEYGYYPLPNNSYDSIENRGISHNVENLLDILKEEISKYTDQKLIIPLSGGFDSRLLLSICVELGLRENIMLKTFGYPGIYDYDIPLRISRSLQIPIVLQDQSLFDYTYDSLVLERSWNKNCLFFHGFIGSMNTGGTIITGAGGDILLGSSQDFRVDTDFLARDWYLGTKRINRLPLKDDTSFLVSISEIEGSFLPNERILIDHRAKSFYEPLVVKDSSDFCSPFLAKKVVEYFGFRSRRKNVLLDLKRRLENYIEAIIGDYPYKNYYGLSANMAKNRLLIAKNLSRLAMHRKMVNNYNPIEKVMDEMPSHVFNNYKEICKALKLDYNSLSVLKTVLPVVIDNYDEIS